jgi:hypothetical protein
VAGVLAAEPKIKDNGRAFIFTDASPRPGTNLSQAVASLRARGIRIDALLTGDCFFSSFADPSLSSNDGTSPLVGFDKTDLSAVEAFSTLAAETGGSFIYQPEVNFGGDAVERFENTVFNVVQGALSQSITLVEPGVVPQDGRIDVTIRGSQTNFRSSSTVTVSGGGVTVQSVDVLSPIELRAVLNVTGSANLSFRDILVETDLGGGNLEQARGIGAIQVTAPPTGARIVGVSPPSGERGDTMTLRITGRNTSFNATSVPDLGAGVTIENVTALSSETLEVRARIEADATIGFRDIRVTTGFEVAAEFVTGPFFVAPEGLEIPVLIDVTPPEGNTGSELTITVEGENTSFVAGLSELSLSGDGITVFSSTVLSPSRLRAEIRIAEDASPGFRDVRVTTGDEIATILGGFLVVEGPDVCTPDETTLCLNGGRFRVKASWRDFDGDSDSAQVVPFGSDDSGLFWFFEDENWEMLIKVIDGCGHNDRFWVFAASTTNVEIILDVTDTRTGLTKSYLNPLGNPAPVLADTRAFAGCDAAVGSPVIESEPEIVRMDQLDELKPVRTRFVPEGEKVGSCVAGPARLCLNEERFQVEVNWRDFEGNAGSAKAVPFGSEDSGLLWFFVADNWEMLIKVINGCGFNDRYWVFAAATTNVEYTMRVTDTMTGAFKEYTNPLGILSPAITDNMAFATCP